MATVSIDGYVLDVNITEEHQFENEVTEHPVEKGSSISDNIRVKPDVVSMESIVSDSPLGEIAKLRSQGSNDVNTISPTEEALAILKAIRKAREPVTIVTSLGTYTNMLMVSLTVPRDSKSGAALQFRTSFKQLDVVTNQRTTVRVAVPIASKKKTLGNKPSKEVTISPARAEARARNARAAQAQKERCDKASITWRTAHC